MICPDPDCGTQNSPGAAICDGCDKPLPIEAKQCLEPEGNATSFEAAPIASDKADNCRCECQEPDIVGGTCQQCGLPEIGGASIASEPFGHQSDQREAKIAQAPPADLLPALQLRFGAGSVMKLGESVFVGRGYAGMPPLLSEWVNTQGGISRRHCLLMFESGCLSVVDLGSKNGTRANGTVLRAGQVHALSSANLPHRIAFGRHAELKIEAREEQS